MAISYVGGKGAGTAGQGGGSISLTTGLTGGSGGAPIAGDLVVVTVSIGTAARAPTTAISTPSGYTPLTAQRTTATTYDTNIQTCYKIMTSTPDTAVTIPASGNNADGISYTIQVFRGVDPTTPMDVTATYATGSGTNSNPNPAAITPTTAGAWIVCCGGGAAAAGAVYTAGYLTNFLTYNGPDTNDGAVGSGYYTAWASGAYDPAAFGGGSANAANSWGATTIALRPKAAVSHGTTGALAGANPALAGTAKHNIPHPASGGLAGAGVVLAGMASRTSPVTEHVTSGALAGASPLLSGAAARTHVHPVSGTLAGASPLLAGSASRTAAPVLHPTASGLAGVGAAFSGAAARTRVHPASGTLSGAEAALSGTAARVGAPVTHSSPGVLQAAGVLLVGQASVTRAHATSGALAGPGAVLSGFAALPAPPYTPPVSSIGGSGGGPSSGGGGPALKQLTKRFEKTLESELDKVVARVERKLRITPTPEPAAPAPEPMLPPEPLQEHPELVKARQLRRQQEEYFILSLLLE